MTLTVDAAQRQSIVPLQQSASSRLAGAFGPRFVTGSHYMSFYIYNMKALDPIECFFSYVLILSFLV